MKKGNIIFDYDQFSFETLSLHIAYLNEKYGIVTTPDDFKDHPPISTVVHKHLRLQNVSGQDLPTEGKIWEDLATEFLASEEWHKKAQPIEGFVDIVKELSNHFDIFIVSARHTGSIPVIWFTLERYGIRQCVTDVRCVHEHLGQEKFLETPKREIIQGLPGENIGFFDDSVNQIVKAQDVVSSYLYDPQQIHRDEGNVQNFITSLYEIPEIVLN